MITRLELSPWARRYMTKEQRVDLVKRTARLGVGRLLVLADRPSGPFFAQLSDRKVFRSAVSPYEAADKLLKEREEQPIAV